MKLLASSPVEIKSLNAETLDGLWRDAEQLGVIEVDSDYKGTTYAVTIRFERRSGTSIRAKGSDSSIHVAMHKAIIEAMEMGAGVEQ